MGWVLPSALVVRFAEILERQDARLPWIGSRVNHAWPVLAGEGRITTPARVSPAVTAIVADLQSSSMRTSLRSPCGTATTLPVVEGMGIFLE